MSNTTNSAGTPGGWQGLTKRLPQQGSTKGTPAGITWYPTLTNPASLLHAWPGYTAPTTPEPAPDTGPLTACLGCAASSPLLERALSLLTRMATGYDWTPEEVDLLQAEIARALDSRRE